MSQEAMKDELTGVFNFDYFQERMKEEIQRSNRYGKPYSVVRFDIDNFKSINDNYGFEFGNNILKQFTILCLSTIRGSDILARQEAEQFLVLLPEVSLDDAFSFAERVRKMVEDSSFFGDDKNKINLTVSSGIATYVRKQGMETGQLLHLLDAAVYQAKQDGRNCIVPYTMFLPEEDLL